MNKKDYMVGVEELEDMVVTMKRGGSLPLHFKKTDVTYKVAELVARLEDRTQDREFCLARTTELLEECIKFLPAAEDVKEEDRQSLSLLYEDLAIWRGG